MKKQALVLDGKSYTMQRNQDEELSGWLIF